MQLSFNWGWDPSCKIVWNAWNVGFCWNRYSLIQVLNWHKNLLLKKPHCFLRGDWTWCTYLYNGSSSFGMVLIYMLSKKNRFYSSCFCILTSANSEGGKQKHAVLCYRMGLNMFIERMFSQDLDFRLIHPSSQIHSAANCNHISWCHCSISELWYIVLCASRLNKADYD